MTFCIAFLLLEKNVTNYWYIVKKLLLLKSHRNTLEALSPDFISLQDYNSNFALKSIASAKGILVCTNLCI